MKWIGIAALTGALLGAVLFADRALGSRNASGTMAGINGPYTAGSVISSSVINARFSDIETEITDSLNRSGKGGMLAALRGTDGTVTAPAFAFTSETGTGLYRIGSSNPGLSVNQSKKQEWTSTGTAITGTASISGDVTASTKLGIGAAPSNFFDMTLSGSATNNLGNWLEASLADGNSMTLNIGKAASAGSLGIITYKKNATAANSTFCLDVYGGSSTLCVDGNSKTYIGSTGTGIATISAGSCTLNGGTPATCTATVVSGAKCVASKVQTGGGTAQSVSVTTTTLTVTSAAAGDTAVANYFCWI